MKKYIFAVLTMIVCSTGVGAYASPGEYWEVTSKMEMPGMPFAMPATTQKVCIPKGSQNDPKRTSGDKDCKVTDVKKSGSKISWKARCDHNGQITTGSGEQTYSANSYHGTMKLSGEQGNMTMRYDGKRVGGSCDTGEQQKKMQAQVDTIKAQTCGNTSNYQSTAEWIGSSTLFLGENAPCPELKAKFCSMVRRDAPRDLDTYKAVQNNEQAGKMMGAVVSVAQGCKLNMSSTTRSICKTLNGENYDYLSRYCPAQAKRYREVQRRKDCEGRSYTAETRAEDLRRCLRGEDDSASGTVPSPAANETSNSSDEGPAAKALEEAKKLKSRFGF